MFAEPTNAASTTANAMRDKPATRNIIKVSLTLAVTLIGLAAVALGYLIYPGTPSKSKVMAFEGFIELPRRGPLTVLDYLTLSDQALFVTSESSGALFKIAFDSSDLKTSTVSEMSGAGAAHGVALSANRECCFHHTKRIRWMSSIRSLFVSLRASQSQTTQMPSSTSRQPGSFMYPMEMQTWRP
jgi:hypothetical protein